MKHREREHSAEETLLLLEKIILYWIINLATKSWLDNPYAQAGLGLGSSTTPQFIGWIHQEAGLKLKALPVYLINRGDQDKAFVAADYQAGVSGGIALNEATVFEVDENQIIPAPRPNSGKNRVAAMNFPDSSYPSLQNDE